MNIEFLIDEAIRNHVNHVYESVEFNPESQLFEDVGCDSLDVMEIIMAVENTTKIKVKDEDICNIYTVSDLYNLFKNAAEK